MVSQSNEANGRERLRVADCGLREGVGLVFALALAVLVIYCVLGPAAQASPGGFSPRPEATTEEAPTGEATVSTLAGEKAIAPPGAPPAVKQVIAAANRIRSTPYVWGGGHARWWDRGYDCSGSVSYALHGGDLLEAPLVSGSFTTWGAPGPGRWITIYANRKHTGCALGSPPTLRAG